MTAELGLYSSGLGVYLYASRLPKRFPAYCPFSRFPYYFCVLSRFFSLLIISIIFIIVSMFFVLFLQRICVYPSFSCCLFYCFVVARPHSTTRISSPCHRCPFVAPSMCCSAPFVNTRCRTVFRYSINKKNTGIDSTILQTTRLFRRKFCSGVTSHFKCHK